MINTDNAVEIWKDVVEFEGLYMISNLGRVKSLPRRSIRKGHIRINKFRKDHFIPVTERIMTPILNKGYPRVTLCKNGKSYYCFCHQLVAKAFIGPVPMGQEVRHKNGDRTDCRLENLEYGTRAQNIADCKRHGNFRNGASHLTEDLVRQIAARHDDTAKVLSKEFGVSIGTIANIRRRRIWTHLNLDLRESYVKKGSQHPARRGKQTISNGE